MFGQDRIEPYHTSVVTPEQRQKTLQNMKPPKRKRPVVAVLADNRGSETTDLIIPWSILSRSGVADAYVVALEDSPIQLMPALSIHPQLTAAQFTERFPGGADYVIVPAFHNAKSPLAIAWVQQQRATNASVVGICAGALPLAYAGLLDNRKATTHWFSRNKLQRVSPTTRLQKDRRYVADNGIITSTGVSASLPLAITLIEAIAGEEVARELANSLHIGAFDAAHNSEYFSLSAQMLYRLAVNSLNVLGHEKIGIEIAEGVDELSLALTADAWSRTGRSRAFTYGETGAVNRTVSSLNKLQIVSAYERGEEAQFSHRVLLPQRPGEALTEALGQIEHRYGLSTASNVAMQLEYPWIDRL